VEDLAPTAWAVLGLLSFGRELSGYELRARAAASPIAGASMGVSM